jgi:hypothetical protein
MSGLASAAWARDVCLVNSGTDYIVLRKVKSLHPGVSVPLNGYRYYAATGAQPVDGSAMMKSDGTVLAGLFVHGLTGGTNNNFTLEWTTDTTLAGWMNFDANGDFQSDGAIYYDAIDCKSVPLP